MLKVSTEGPRFLTIAQDSIMSVIYHSQCSEDESNEVSSGSSYVLSHILQYILIYIILISWLKWSRLQLWYYSSFVNSSLSLEHLYMKETLIKWTLLSHLHNSRILNFSEDLNIKSQSFNVAYYKSVIQRQLKIKNRIRMFSDEETLKVEIEIFFKFQIFFHLV